MKGGIVQRTADELVHPPVRERRVPMIEGVLAAGVRAAVALPPAHVVGGVVVGGGRVRGARAVLGRRLPRVVVEARALRRPAHFIAVPVAWGNVERVVRSASAVGRVEGHEPARVRGVVQLLAHLADPWECLNFIPVHPHLRLLAGDAGVARQYALSLL